MIQGFRRPNFVFVRSDNMPIMGSVTASRIRVRISINPIVVKLIGLCFAYRAGTIDSAGTCSILTAMSGAA